MASWRHQEPARVEPPGWYRTYDPAAWDAPDAAEQAMIDGCADYRCWPDSPDSAWLNWPQWLHDEHARRRWTEAKYAYRQENPALAEQEFNDLVNGEREARRRERHA